MEDSEPIVLQVYCRVEVVVDDPDAVLELAGQRLQDADVDWSAEKDTVEDAAAELRGDLIESLASLVDPDRLACPVCRCGAGDGGPSGARRLTGSSRASLIGSSGNGWRYGGCGSRVRPVWARNPVMSSGRYWMRLRRFFTVAVSWSTLQAVRLPRQRFMCAHTPSAALSSGA